MDDNLKRREISKNKREVSLQFLLMNLKDKLIHRAVNIAMAKFNVYRKLILRLWKQSEENGNEFFNLKFKKHGSW